MHQGLPSLLPLEGDEDAFPRFMTRQQLLLFIDSHLGSPFFQGNRAGAWVDRSHAAQSLTTHHTRQNLLGRLQALEKELAQATEKCERVDLEQKLNDTHEMLRQQDVNYDIGSNTQQASHRSTKKVTRGSMVDFSFFSTVVWPKLHCSALSKSAVFTEIFSHIKGCAQSLHTNGELSEAEYISLPHKTAPVFSDRRGELYGIYTNYKALKKDLNAWDSADLVCHCFNEVRENGWRGPPIHSLLADEIQDFTQAECSLMVEICEDSNQLFMCGDTAGLDEGLLSFCLPILIYYGESP
jgi:hypothetical protein